MGGLATIEDTHKTFLERGVRKISPFFVPSLIINLAPGQITLRYGLKGPNFSPVSACATGNHSIGDAIDPHRARDRRRDGGRRHRGHHHAARHRRLLRGPGPLRAQRRAGEGQPAVRQGAGRLRAGRGRGRAGARGVRARPQARRAHLRRAGRLRRHQRRPPHHRARRPTARAASAPCAWRWPTPGSRPSRWATSTPTAPRRRRATSRSARRSTRSSAITRARG